MIKKIIIMRRTFAEYLWLLGVFLSISLQSVGQEMTPSLIGTLVSEGQSIPLEYAEVLVTDLSDSIVASVLTDEKGTFSIPLKRGIYILRYRELGEILDQDTIEFQNDKNLGLIAVPIVHKKLQEVTVFGTKKVITLDKNKLIYSVQNSPYANGFSAKDVVQNLPGINPIKPNEISLVGKDGVLVLINGHKSNLKGKDLINYLSNIPSRHLDKIEIVTNPSSEFSALGNIGVLNIILRNRMNLGLDGSLSTGYVQRSTASFEEGGNLSFSNNWLMMEYGIGYWKEKRKHDVRNSLEYTDYTMTIHNGSCQKPDYVSQNLNTEIFLNNEMTLGFMASFNYMDEGMVSDVYRELSGDRYAFSSEQTRSDGSYKGLWISPYYEWKIDSLGKKLTINYSYNLTKKKSHSDYLSDADLDVLNSLYDNRYLVNTCNLDFTLPFSWLTFELGGEYSHYHGDNYAFYHTVDDFRYKETVKAFYADINKSWQRVSFKIGARYEHTKSEGFPSEGTNHFSWGCADWFPFVDIAYKSGASSGLYLGYSRRISRPDMQQLNPTRFYTDTYTSFVGNSFLRPSLMDYVEFGYQYKALNIGLSYIHTSDGIGILVNDKAGSRIEQTYSNCISANSLAGRVNYNYSHNRFSAAVQLSASYNKSKSSDRSLDGSSLEGFSSFASGNLSYMIGKVQLYASYLYYFPGQEQYLHYESFQNLSIGINCELVKNRLLLNSNVNDLLGTYYNRNRVVYTDFVFNNRNDYDNRCLTIKLTYRFGNHKVKRSDVNINSSNNRLPSAKR